MQNNTATVAEFVPYKIQIRRMATALGVVCHIPQGDQLVLMIGNGDESSNMEALESWVARQLELNDDLSSRELIEELMRRLFKDLESWPY